MDSKTCKKCGEAKALDAFGVAKTNADGRKGACNTCLAAVERERYLSRGVEGRAKRQGERRRALDSYREKERARQGNRRESHRARAAEARVARGCAECGECHPAVLQFHHVDPEVKSFTINRAVMKCYRWEEVEKEMAKCVVLCANCHAKLHWEERRGQE